MCDLPSEETSRSKVIDEVHLEEYQVVEESGSKCATITCQSWFIKAENGNDKTYYWHPGAPSDRQHLDAARYRATPQISEIIVEEDRKIHLNWTKVEYDRIIFQSDSFKRVVQYYNQCSESEEYSPIKKGRREKKLHQGINISKNPRMDLKAAKRKLLNNKILSTKSSKKRMVEMNKEDITSSVVGGDIFEKYDILQETVDNSILLCRPIPTNEPEVEFQRNGGKMITPSDEGILKIMDNVDYRQYSESTPVPTPTGRNNLESTSKICTPVSMCEEEFEKNVEKMITPDKRMLKTMDNIDYQRYSAPTPTGRNNLLESTPTICTAVSTNEAEMPKNVVKEVTLEGLSKKIDNSSARITRIERTLAIILKGIKNINERLDIMISNNSNTTDDAVSDLRTLFPISTRIGFEDVEEKLKTDAAFRNKFCQYLTHMKDIHKTEDNVKRMIERMLDCLFSRSITDFGNWSGIRENENKKKVQSCMAFKETECFQMFVDQFVKHPSRPVETYHTIQEWIRNKRGTKVRKSRNPNPEEGKGKRITNGDGTVNSSGPSSIDDAVLNN